MTDPAEVRAEGRRLLERYETSDPVKASDARLCDRCYWRGFYVGWGCAIVGLVFGLVVTR